VGTWSDSAILGMQELQTLGLSIYLEGMVVTQDDQRILTYMIWGSWVSRQVVVRKDMMVPARAQSIIMEPKVRASTICQRHQHAQ
jgi:hypothetical protein